MTITENDITKGEYIDLGLPSGLKWASCNLGATSPCEYGDYYMWGSVTPNTDDVCNWATAPFNGGASEFDEEYFNAHKSEWLDGDILKPEYDAAYQATDGNAHMPTKADWDELLAYTLNRFYQCIIFDSENKEHTVNGRLFTSTNGNSIFIPTVGNRYGASFNYRGSDANVWSSSLDTSYPFRAFLLGFFSDNCGVYHYDRFYGYAIRAVTE